MNSSAKSDLSKNNLDHAKNGWTFENQEKQPFKPSLQKSNDQFDGLIYENPFVLKKKSPSSYKQIREFKPEQTFPEINKQTNISKQLMETSRFESDMIVQEERKSFSNNFENPQIDKKPTFDWYMNMRNTEISVIVKNKRKSQSFKNEPRNQTPLDFKGKNYFENILDESNTISSVKVDQRDLMHGIGDVVRRQNDIIHKNVEIIEDMRARLDNFNERCKKMEEIAANINPNNNGWTWQWTTAAVVTAVALGFLAWKFVFPTLPSDPNKSNFSPPIFNISAHINPSPTPLTKATSTLPNFNFFENSESGKKKFITGYALGLFSFPSMVLWGKMITKILK